MYFRSIFSLLNLNYIPSFRAKGVADRGWRIVFFTIIFTLSFRPYDLVFASQNLGAPGLQTSKGLPVCIKLLERFADIPYLARWLTADYLHLFWGKKLRAREYNVRTSRGYNSYKHSLGLDDYEFRSGDSVLDLGSGGGRFIKQLDRSHIQVLGIDLDPPKSQVKKGIALKGDMRFLNEIPELNGRKFNLIVSNWAFSNLLEGESLNHIVPTAEKIIDGMLNHLAANGEIRLSFTIGCLAAVELRYDVALHVRLKPQVETVSVHEVPGRLGARRYLLIKAKP